MEKKNKKIYVDSEIHKEIKILATKKDKSIKQFASEVLKERLQAERDLIES